MISYAAFWLVPLLSIFNTTVSAACNSAVSCLCGSSNNTYSLCIDAVTDKENPCNVWSHCKTCQENIAQCSTCPENRTGPTCLEVKSIRKKRQYEWQTVDESLFGSCKRLESPLGSINCQRTNNFRSCTGRCLPGYSFVDSDQEQITLVCRMGRWTPRLTFPACISGGHCNLEMTLAGSFNCSTAMNGSRCDVICNGKYQGRYHCFPGKSWTPSLPYCAKPKGGSSSERPPHPPQRPPPPPQRPPPLPQQPPQRPTPPFQQPPPPPQRPTPPSKRPPSPPPCPCQNNGICDSSGNCVCSKGWTGTYCDRKEDRPSCPDPGFPSGGERGTEDGTPAPIPRSFSVGELVVFSCRGRDIALQGVSLIECRADGTWSAPRPRCFGVRPPDSNPMTCKQPDVNSNGKIVKILSPIDPSRIFQRYLPGSEVAYSCKNGYDLQGQSVIFCRLSGEWSGSAPTCTLTDGSENQPAQYCPIVEPAENRIVLFDDMWRPGEEDEDEPEDDVTDFPPGTHLHFSCKDGFIIIGSNNLVCRSTGYWNIDAPICIEDCGRSLTRTRHKLIGSSSTVVGEWPWMVAMKNHSRFICGGALIDNQTVLTAAHCVFNYSLFTLSFGKFYRDDGKDDTKVEKRQTKQIIIHERFNSVTYDNDIALLRFEPSVDYSERIKPICLPTPNSTAKNFAPGNMGSVTGWGFNEKKLLSEKLMLAHLPVQPDEECMDAYEEHGLDHDLHPGMFCAGYTKGEVNTCRGDSGSPLVFLDGETHRHTIEGLVSFGNNKACDEARAYTVFTKVGHYMPWILMNWPCPSGMRRSELNTCS